ncbi:MAG: hypothetical protein JWP91_4104 [Fibrobacteres bacterium]|nr:hypothetical protein [Fibrobacterota bacterium]
MGCAPNYFMDKRYKSEKEIHLYIRPIGSTDISMDEGKLRDKFMRSYKLSEDSAILPAAAAAFNKEFKTHFRSWKTKFTRIDTAAFAADSQFKVVKYFDLGNDQKKKMEMSVPTRESLVKNGVTARFILVTEDVRVYREQQVCGSLGTTCTYLVAEGAYAIWDYEKENIVGMGGMAGSVSASLFIADSDWGDIFKAMGMNALRRSPFYEPGAENIDEEGRILHTTTGYGGGG